MAFEGSFRDRFIVQAPLDVAVRVFADPGAHVAAFDGLDRHDRLSDDSVAFVLPEMSYGVTKFRGVYACRYRREGDTVRWESLDRPGDNIRSRGVVRFTAQGPDRCQVDYDQTLEIGLQVGRLLQATIRPLVERGIQKEARAFCQRLVAQSEAAARQA
ncbi:MAG: SRPBCC family protein [Alphaproteobacteria bacterium]|nr:SRPBCC family protein [Alphaproteobacteria bacterium]